MRGRTYASITVVHVRSYSRYSPETRCESEISPSNPSFRRIASAASSCTGFAYAFMKQIATDATSSAWKTSSAAATSSSTIGVADLAVRQACARSPASAGVAGRAAPAGARRGRRDRRGRRERSRGCRGSRVCEQADDGARAGEERVEADGRAVEEVARGREPLRQVREAAIAVSTPSSGADGVVGSFPTWISPVSSS